MAPRIDSSTFLVILMAAVCIVPAAAGLKYTAQETELINKFRELMGAELYQDYMKSDDYLITWLRSQRMDLRSSQAMLRKHLEWRKSYRMDTILNEDFGSFYKMLEVTSKGFDKEGRPILTVYYGTWNLRRVVLAGQAPKLRRYEAQLLERVAHTIRTVNATSQHKNITQVLFILDGNGYNLRQHACVLCIPEYVSFLGLMESNYPFITSKIILVNVPRIAEAVLTIIRPLLHPDTRKAFYVYGPDKDQWGPVLLNLVDEDQLPVRLGGKAKW